MMRTAVVTGSASGIGAATKALLEARGDRVIGADVHDADVIVDLATSEGCDELVDEVARLCDGGHLDAVYAVAGSASATPTTVALNFFGAVGTLQRLRPLLTGSPTPRAVAVTSLAATHPCDGALLDAMQAASTPAAMARAAELSGDSELGLLIYPSSKKALAQWVRRNAPTADWAGAGIPLNAVAPGTTATAMTTPFLATAEGTAALLAVTPMPLNGVAEPDVVARALTWLGSEDNTHMCGQIIFVDGGSDALLRGENAW